MLITSWLLAALAVALAWPVPVLLSRASWPSRAPAAAMLLWQGIALAGGLSMIGAFLTWGLAPLGDALLPAVWKFALAVVHSEDYSKLTLVHVFALSVAGLLTIQLLLTLVRSAWRMSRRRQRHRTMLHLLARSTQDDSRPGTLIIEHSTPAAYCLPGSGSVTVLTSGLLARLSPAELRAVLAHEAAHLNQRHDLLLLAFTSWHAALPWLPTTRLALAAVGVLVEELADDAALRSVERTDLLGALAVISAGTSVPANPVPSTTGTTSPAATGQAGDEAAAPATAPQREGALPGADAASDAGTLAESLTSARLHRLLSPPTPWPRWKFVATACCGVGLVVAPTLTLLLAGWSH